MQSEVKKICLLSIMAIFYMYISTICTAFEINIVIFNLFSDRALLLTIIVLIGLVVIGCKRYFRYNKIITSGLILAIYMTMIGCYSRNMGLLSWISCSSMWVLVIAIFYNYQGNEVEDRYKNLFAYLGALLAIIYIVGSITPRFIATIVSINSIYYVLCAIPFVIKCPNRVVRLVLLMIVTTATIISGKSTCVVAIALIWIIMLIYDKKKGQSVSLSGVMAFLTALVAFLGMWSFLKAHLASGSIVEVFLDVWKEFSLGGNGRSEIYQLALSKYSESNLFGQLFGHGFGAIDDAMSIGTHNDFLMVLYNYGVIGVILYVHFWISLIFECRKQILNRKNEYIAFLSSIIIYFVLSMASNVLNTQIQFLLLCVFWGIYSEKNTYLVN